MTPRDFVYWMQGLIEIGQPENLNKEQIEMIKRHLNLVLTNVTDEIKPNLTPAPFRSPSLLHIDPAAEHNTWIARCASVSPKSTDVLSYC